MHDMVGGRSGQLQRPADDPPGVPRGSWAHL